MYFILRIILGVAILLILLWLLRKFKLDKLRIVAYILALILMVTSVFFPFENLFVTFSHSYDAFEYCYNPVIKQIDFCAVHIDGDVVVGKTYLGGTVIGACPATYDGFKLPAPFNYKKIASTTSDGIKLEVYWCKQMQKHFSVVTLRPEVNVTGVTDDFHAVLSIKTFVTDNVKSRFTHGDNDANLLSPKYEQMYIAIIDELPQTYTVTYENKSVSVSF